MGELLATFEFRCGLDWSILDRLVWKLEERGQDFYIVLSPHGGSRIWSEISLPQWGFWPRLEQFFDASSGGRPFLDQAILARFKPQTSEPD